MVNKHQLIYLMEGKGRILPNDREYEVAKGAGICLSPLETATIQASTGEALSFGSAAGT
jgi:hypothetical protein